MMFLFRAHREIERRSRQLQSSLARQSQARAAFEQSFTEVATSPQGLLSFFVAGAAAGLIPGKGGLGHRLAGGLRGAIVAILALRRSQSALESLRTHPVADSL